MISILLNFGRQDIDFSTGGRNRKWRKQAACVQHIEENIGNRIIHQARDLCPDAEIGRYCNTPQAERTCFHCRNAAAYELHVLINSPLHVDFREYLLKKTVECWDVFMYATDAD